MLDIAFVTDFVCPYCLVAKEALEQAILELNLRKDVKITYYPYELTPPEKEQVDTVHDTVRLTKYAALSVAAEELMMTSMKIPPNVSPRPRTRLAWEAWLYACDHDRAGLWGASMYHAYFMDELDIGDREVLLHIAKTLLMNTADLAAAWDEGRYTQRLLDMEQEAREKFQPRGVPCIYINGRYAKIKDYTKDEMVYRLMEAMENARKESAQPTPETTESGPVCGVDGCDPEPMTGASCGVDGCN